MISHIASSIRFLRRGLLSHNFRCYSRLNSPQNALLNRTLDRQHRAGYNSLERVATKYRPAQKRQTPLQPIIPHLLVLIRHSSDRLGDISFDPSASLSSKPKPENLVEPLLFNITAHIVGLKMPIDIQRSQIAAIKAHITRLQLPQSQVDITVEIQTFLHVLSSKFDIKDHEIDYKLLGEAIEGLFALLPLHSAVDIAQFVASIISPNVKSASACLEQRSNIPSCLLLDMLLRTPLSKEELYLQLEVWRIFHKKLCYFYNTSPKRIALCFDNLVYYSLKYDLSKIASLVAYSLRTFEQTQTRRSSILLESFLNSLMWNIALYNQNPRQALVQKLCHHVSKAQEAIVRHYSQRNPEEEAYGFLLLKGYLAISLAIAPISMEKAQVIFERASTKFLRPSEYETATPDELLAFYYVYIFFSDNPDTLMHRFNESAQQWSHSGRIWSALIMKLTDFGILSERRSVKILQHMLRKKETLLISKNTISLLLEGIKSLQGLDAFTGAAIACSNESLEQTIKNACFSKYLQLLYRDAYHQNQTIKPEKFVSLRKMYPGTESRALEMAREQFRNWKHKSPGIVGQYIYGESGFTPERIYEMFLQYVETPTEAAICGLIRAAVSTSKKDECILWGEMYAPQVAIHEVRTYVMRHNNGEGNDEYGYENAHMIAPTERFWKHYVAMLVKYDYVRELSDIMPWWEELEYRPRSDVLLQLLLGLPEGIGERHVMHVEKLQREAVRLNLKDTRNRGREQWPWPTVEEVRAARSWRGDVHRHR